MGVLDLWGHIAYLFIGLGMFLIGRRKIYGWPIKAVGDVIWLILGFKLGMSSIWLWELVFLSTTAYGYWQWCQAGKGAE